MSAAFESTTLVTGASAVRLRVRMVATRRSPVVVAAAGETESVALAVAFCAPNLWATTALAFAVCPGSIPVKKSDPTRRTVDPSALRDATAARLRRLLNGKPRAARVQFPAP